MQLSHLPWRAPPATAIPGGKLEAEEARVRGSAPQTGASRPTTDQLAGAGRLPDATHHDTACTALRATAAFGDDISGLRRPPETQNFGATRRPLDLSLGEDSTQGRWGQKHLPAHSPRLDGLGRRPAPSWPSAKRSGSGAVPRNGTRQLREIAPAYLDTLVRVADGRASGRQGERDGG